MDTKESTDHLVLGSLLFLVFTLVVALVFVYTRAGDTTTGGVATTTATINNTSPVVDTVNVAYSDEGSHIATSTGIDLAVGSTKALWVWGQVSDANGEADIASTSLVFYRTGAGITSDDNNYQYSVDSCTIDNRTGTTADYHCEIALEYYADGTTTGAEFPADDWTASITVTDLSAADDTLTAAAEINALTALNIPAAIDYDSGVGGSFALGDSTLAGTNQEMPIYQRGNTIADVEVSGTAMTCDALGTIPVGNQEWSLTDVDAGSATDLTGTGVDTDLAVQYRTNDSSDDALKTLYWNITIPSTGVRGQCTGTNTITVLLGA